MFERAGGKTPIVEQKDGPVAKVVAEAASAITSALSGSTNRYNQQSNNSPAKLIESRSKLYKQLSEL